MKRSLLWSLAVLPAFLLVAVIVKYSVNVPFSDQWNTPATIIEHSLNGSVSFSHFWAQHNESRKFFPRLIFLALAHLTQWNVRAEMAISVLLACVISWNLYCLIRKTIPLGDRLQLWCWFLMNLLVFSPIQFDNWLWGIQSIVFVPIACITLGLNLICSKARLRYVTTGCIALSVVASFSFSNGLLVWIILLSTLLIRSHRNRVSIVPIAIAGGLSFLICLLAYFHDYQSNPDHPSYSEVFLYPFHALGYFFTFLGSPLGDMTLARAQAVGFMLMVAFLLLTIYLWRERQKHFLNALPWLSVGAYSIASALLSTAGRVGFGVDQATTARYTTIALYLTVACIGLTGLVASDWTAIRLMPRSPSSSMRGIALDGSILAGATALLLILYSTTALAALDAIAVTHRNRIHAKACLLLSQVLPVDDCIRNYVGHPRPEGVKRKVVVFGRAGLLRPPPPQDLILKAAPEDRPVGADYGALDRFRRTPDGYETNGWAAFPQRRTVADAVILAYRLDGDRYQPFALAPVEDYREDILELGVAGDRTLAYSYAGWSVNIPLDRLPPEATEVAAWALDVNTLETFQLAGKATVAPTQAVSSD